MTQTRSLDVDDLCVNEDTDVHRQPASYHRCLALSSDRFGVLVQMALAIVVVRLASHLLLEKSSAPTWNPRAVSRNPVTWVAMPGRAFEAAVSRCALASDPC